MGRWKDLPRYPRGPSLWEPLQVVGGIGEKVLRILLSGRADAVTAEWPGQVLNRLASTARPKRSSWRGFFRSAGGQGFARLASHFALTL